MCVVTFLKKRRAILDYSGSWDYMIAYGKRLLSLPNTQFPSSVAERQESAFQECFYKTRLANQVFEFLNRKF